jgi:5'-methylthioadenosine phosphorylase
MEPAIGVIGGSGLYQIDSLTETREYKIDTPFGPPSDLIIGGTLAGRPVFFLPRHARGHRILPHELPHRANIWALRSLGVRWIICVTAVGSLQEEYHPRHVVLPDQFFDRTSQIHTFFGEGIVGHVAFADPISTDLRKLLFDTARELEMPVHDGGTYVNMDGPQFSTRAESETNRRLGFDIIGMTNLAEAKLAREAEIAYATLALVTDYDCWHPDHESVTVDAVVKVLHDNATLAQAVVRRLVPLIGDGFDSPAHHALATAIITDRKVIPAEKRAQIELLAGKYLASS